MNSRKILMAGIAVIMAVPALAHNWGCWKQSYSDPYVRNNATYWSEANTALDDWTNNTSITWVKKTSHTENSVYDGDYGNTGWGGLASIESSSGCSITHGHAKLNYYYSYSSNGKRGIFCQEVGHLLGLDHSNDGGCMGGGYFYPIDTGTGYKVVSHNVSDIAAKYGSGKKGLGPSVQSDRGALRHSDDHQTVIKAFWHNNPRTLAEAREMSTAVVIAKVAGTFDNEDIVVYTKGRESGEDRIPNQTVVLDVQTVLSGKIENKVIELFHTGNENFVLEGDPTYKDGETYVLFVMLREDGTYRAVSPEGRYRVEGGRLEPMRQDGFAGVLKSARVQDLARDLTLDR